MLDLKIFGESHGEAIGCTLTGLPSGIFIDENKINGEMARRAPGNYVYTTARVENDDVSVLSGINDGYTSGFPISAIIKNTNVRSGDYKDIKRIPRPNHADYAAYIKFGDHTDLRGGGHFSGRLTAPLVYAGAVCKQFLETLDIKIAGHVKNIGNIYDDELDYVNPDPDLLDRLSIENFPVINIGKKDEMLDLISKVKEEGDSIGGSVQIIATDVPAGLGDPMWNGVENIISKYIFAVPAVKGIEFGNGFNFCELKGSEANDSFYAEDGEIYTATNRCGGILGGITSGMPIVVTAGFKPTPSISKAQKSVDMDTMQNVEMQISGRHDPCIVPRAVTCVEAAVAIALTSLVLGE